MHITVLDVDIDTETKQVERAGKQLQFSAREYDLLLFFAQRANRVVTRDEIRDALYTSDVGQESNLIDVYVRYLRIKLGAPVILHTRRGRGYVFGEDI